MQFWPPLTHRPPSSDSPPGLVVLAASARAIGCSLNRDGYQVRCVDFFGDIDTPHVSRVAHPDDPAAIVAAVAAAAPPDWPLVYGGAMENRPGVLAAIAATGRTILGTQPADLTRLHRELREVVTAAGGLMPREQPGDAPRPGGDWIWKPAFTAAGAAIGPVRGSGPGVWQQRVPGESIGGAMIAGGNRVTPLGLIRHHRRPTAETSQPFFVMDLTYDPADPVPDELRRLAELIAATFAIDGPFGLDAIARPDGSVVLLECNPRMTAGMELIERAAGGPPLVYGKRVVLADRDRVSKLRVDDSRGVDDSCGVDRADIPRPGTPISRGQPWCSVFATGKTTADCRAALDTAERAVQTSGPASASSSSSASS